MSKNQATIKKTSIIGIFIFWLCLIFSVTANATGFLEQLSKPGATTGEPSYVSPDESFQLFAEVVSPHEVELHWIIRPGAYLYKHEIKIHSNNAELGAYTLPEGTPKHDQWLGDYEVYYDDLKVMLPIIEVTHPPLILTVDYLGCAENDFCYPPITKTLELNMQAVGSSATQLEETPPTVTSPETTTEIETAPTISEQERISQIFTTEGQGKTLWLFFGFGLLLAFTPCVLPMIPILTSIIAGQGKQITKLRAFFLSGVYVIAMAATYAIAGIIAGKLGANLQSAFQTPWLLSLFAVLFILLAFSLFGFFEIKLPHGVTQKLNTLHGQQQGGTWIGVIAMGILSALVVSPCITPPLVGALAYISQTGDASLGGYSLFVMGLGMGVPLIIAATLEGYLLPKAGPWMNTVKDVFGVLLLALAITMLERFMKSSITLAMWALLFIISGIMMGALNRVRREGWPKFWKGLGIAFLAYGLIMLVGVGLGNNDPFNPLKLPHTSSVTQTAPTTTSQIIPIQNVAQLEEQLSLAQQQNQYTMVEFTAQWCVSCQKMKETTFKDPQVLAKLAAYRWLQVDVSDNTAEDKALMKKLNVFAPPSFVFFNPNGQEVTNARVVGEKDAAQFLAVLNQIP